MAGYRINLYWMDGIAKSPNLATLCSILNKKQKTFDFVFHPNRLLKFPKGTPYGKKHSYEHKQYYDLLKGEAGGYKIGITQIPLEDNCFNHQDVSDKNNLMGLVTLKDMKTFNVSGRNEYQYLSYLIVCVTVCMVMREDLELGHEKNNFCLFDPCLGKESLKDSIQSPFICGDCIDKINSKSDINGDFLRDTLSLLKYVEKDNKSDIIFKTLTMPFMSIPYVFILDNVVSLIIRLVRNSTSTIDVYGESNGSTQVEYLSGFEGWLIGLAVLFVLLIVCIRFYKYHKGK